MKGSKGLVACVIGAASLLGTEGSTTTMSIQSPPADCSSSTASSQSWYTQLCATDAATPTTCTVATIDAQITSFKTCISTGTQDCSCYKTFYRSLWDANCLQAGDVQEYLARQGFRYGMGYPTFSTTDLTSVNSLFKVSGGTCGSTDFNGTVYTGAGTLLSAETNCIKACTSICSRDECSSASGTYVNLVFATALAWVASKL
mmetsp:Transcript_21203/g.34506  ORF Transcript_21203/g.34506 Transcript_21203/m.34506 type:complete len:202 (-) Transcript_21203:1694-2299(-)